MRKSVLWLALLLLAVCEARSADKGLGDVTAKLEDLGIPNAQRYKHAYPRNVWTLKAFDGKIFVGAGNSANSGPAQNAGPVPVMVFDPATRKFTKEWDAPDEQIDVFRVFDGALYIPGHDPKEDWKFGNYYCRKAGGAQWEKVRTIPGAVHCYDMAKLGGKLYAGGSGLWASQDKGKTFQQVLRFNRYYAFLNFPKTVYAVADGRIFPAPRSVFDEKTKKTAPQCTSLMAVCLITPEDWSVLYNGVDKFFPGVDTKNIRLQYKITRTLPFKDKVLFISGIAHNDHQIVPLAANCATDGAPELFKFTRIELPAGATPWCFAVAQNKAFLLFAQKDKSGKNDKNIVNHLWQSADGVKFTPLLSFKAATFARAVEYLDGYFYFGMGTEFAAKNAPKDVTSVVSATEKDLSPESGRIYRIKYKVKK